MTIQLYTKHKMMEINRESHDKYKSINLETYEFVNERIEQAFENEWIDSTFENFLGDLKVTLRDYYLFSQHIGPDFYHTFDYQIDSFLFELFEDTGVKSGSLEWDWLYDFFIVPSFQSFAQIKATKALWG